MDLSSDYSLADLPVLHGELQRLLSETSAPRIETGALNDASLALVQLLFSAHLSARSLGKRLEISCPEGGALARALEGFGFLEAVDTRPRLENGTWSGLTAA
ncbi:STAS domain-containing protein [Rhodobacter aestuarii]|uniref:STAS domain-containing protein n=1 Tax=Rhodobacter aestuarii TaxID=453582 RepID=A0A1N7QE00_9RHOB|nr:STAS domain-containing protein [Rhodobacter aestuarii]PTV93576.1 STAS domain-containing protein [Rhodobacter aestuarii]SIT20797.1 STAS domain-containing protein [Rhodobacter aestuarii]